MITAAEARFLSEQIRLMRKQIAEQQAAAGQSTPKAWPSNQ